jgi:hypothetical protein
MARSYVLSFPDERRAFEAFMQDTPANAVMLVDTFDTLTGVRHAIEAARATGVLKGVRLDSGDLLALSRAARALLDDAGMPDARIVASGDLDERGIAALVAAGAPRGRAAPPPPPPARRSTSGASAPRWAPATTRRPSAASTSSSPTNRPASPGGPSPSAHPTRPPSPAPSRSTAAPETAP